MVVLVTGGCGLMGSFAVRHAVQHEHKVIAFDIALKTELLEDVLNKVTFVRGDVLAAPEIMRAVREHRVDRILHTASFLTPGAYERPYAAVQTIIMGTLNVLECARTLGVERVVHVSTGKTTMTGAAFNRSAKAGRLAVDADPYTSAKLATELLCNDYRGLYGMEVMIVRPGGQIFGPGYGFAGALGQGLKDIVEKPLRGEPVRLTEAQLSYSQKVVSMLYAADAGRGVMMATLAARLEDYVFTLAPVEKATAWEVGDAVAELIPGADIQMPRGAEKGGPAELDPRTREQLGYVPEYSVKRGLKEYIEFLRTGRYRQL